ncbi:methionyl-tRNA formyltransferase [Vibrio cholerae]|uniref:methionyl-tRNA formyltransferase n=1 Tax=Vibrio cholerae TaxID=666 RepID=UPI00084D3A6F|nr:formyltransferase family protein [Vibrio cholerae]EGQ9395313.1 methionyl-tRNA formyltransferase [Vibrio cholerae]EGR0942257.1 methionyl-tRNA formyltransferase [Vibrio cholerae]EGR1420693.1 methionyl-tRNA formyltransferase [Vibrio cholerae]EGR4140543.1 methionyl-tRNA formyltransferase [Vibrio cholerae]EHV2410641.1 methionyl-tRNA formyltransferase [Vibrio cholerae]
MRVIIITSGISRILKPIYDNGFDVVGVLESMPRGWQPNSESKFHRVLKGVYHSVFKRGTSLESFCFDKAVPYNKIYKGNDVAITSWVKDLNPDLIVVFSMSQLLKKDLIDIPKLGVINLHPSMLPEYRGPNPDFWQYYNMEMNPGVTIHYIDEGEDTGDIIFQERVHIPLGTKSPERLDKLIGGVGSSLLLKAIQAIKSGSAPRIPQPSHSSTFRARNLKSEEHKEIIDWQNWPIERIWHVLRGTELWLNAYDQPKGIFKGQRWVVEEYERKGNIEQPGAIVRYKGRKAVATPDGYIFININFSLKKALLFVLNFKF